ncbi:hypothetical protein HDU93_003013 [Gonapodya sp. JEL0774]|nr:hypothetical protein HDU93_003013 [Gonapodya sp. JEL0774]
MDVSTASSQEDDDTLKSDAAPIGSQTETVTHSTSLNQHTLTLASSSSEIHKDLNHQLQPSSDHSPTTGDASHAPHTMPQDINSLPPDFSTLAKLAEVGLKMGTGLDSTLRGSQNFSNSHTDDSEKPQNEDAETIATTLRRAVDDVALSLNAANAKSDADVATSALRTELERAIQALMTSRDTERQLIERCDSLRDHIRESSVHFQTCLKLAVDYKTRLTQLDKQQHRQETTIEELQEKEVKVREALHVMTAENMALKRELAGKKARDLGSAEDIAVVVDEKAGPPMKADPSELRNSGKYTQEEYDASQEKSTQLAAQLASSNVIIANLHDQMTALRAELSSCSADSSSLAAEVASLSDNLGAQRALADREIRARERIESQLKAVTLETVPRKDSEIQSLNHQITKLKAEVRTLAESLTAEKTKTDASVAAGTHLNQKLSALHHEYDKALVQNAAYVEQMRLLEQELLAMDDGKDKEKEGARKWEKKAVAMEKKAKAFEDKAKLLEAEIESLHSTLDSTKDSLQRATTDLTQANNSISEAGRDRDIVTQQLVRAVAAAKRQADAVKLKEQEKDNVEEEMKSYRAEAAKMRKLIFHLERTLDTHLSQQTALQGQLDAAVEAAKMKDMSVLDSKKRIVEMEKRIEEQQALYETVRADRNHYSSSLLEAQDEIGETKRKLKIVLHQLEQLKEEVAAKDKDITKARFEASKFEKEKEQLTAQIAKLELTNDRWSELLKSQQVEHSHLQHTISENQRTIARLQTNLSALTSERDTLSSNIQGLDTTLSLLQEKLSLQTRVLERGEKAYLERTEDIRVLKLEVKRLRREKKLLEDRGKGIDGLKSEVVRLQKEWMRERMRVKVLEEELVTPMNLHRWRALAGTDPATTELISKLHFLQHRLLQLTTQLCSREQSLTTVSNSYQKIKALLSKMRPSDEILEENRKLKADVTRKTRETRAISSELTMYVAREAEHKMEIGRLNREVQDNKKRFFEERRKAGDSEKRREAKVRGLLEGLAKSGGGIMDPATYSGGLAPGVQKVQHNRDGIPLAFPVLPVIQNGPKFLGGGFKVAGDSDGVTR